MILLFRDIDKACFDYLLTLNVNPDDKRALIVDFIEKLALINRHVHVIADMQNMLLSLTDRPPVLGLRFTDKTNKLAWYYQNGNPSAMLKATAEITETTIKQLALDYLRYIKTAQSEKIRELNEQTIIITENITALVKQTQAATIE